MKNTNTLTKVLCICLLSLILPKASLATPEQSCEVLTEERAIYSGTARCDTHPFSQSVSDTFSQFIVLSGMVDGFWRSCPAEVPFSRIETVTFEGCHYDPEVTKITSSVNNPLGDTTWVTLKGTASDYDGNIASYEWYIDDIKQNKIGSTIVITIDHSGYRKVRLQVTDNQGYRSSMTKNFNWSIVPTCGEYC